MSRENPSEFGQHRLIYAYSGFAAGREAAGGTSTDGPRSGVGTSGGVGNGAPGGGVGFTGLAG